MLIAAAVACTTSVGGCLGTPSDDGTATNDDGGDTDGGSDADGTVTGDAEPSTTEPTPTETTGATAADADETVLVAPDGSLAFDPAELRVASGTTVAFVWRGSGHNIAVTNQPDDAAWAGVSEVQDAGYQHRHTFEVAGAYDYVCEPHEFAGMTGRVVVGDGD